MLWLMPGIRITRSLCFQRNARSAQYVSNLLSSHALDHHVDVADLLDALEGFPVTEPNQVLPGDPETLDKCLVHVALYNVSSLL